MEVSTHPDVLLSSGQLAATLQALANQIHQTTANDGTLAVIGVQQGGVPTAWRVANLLSGMRGTMVEVGVLDVSMHRDDLDQRFAPDIHPTHIPFNVAGRTIVLVDDVMGSGRTIRAALESLHEMGRPGRVYLGVLIDRGGRELPIQPDFVGKIVSTGPGENVKVHFQEHGGPDEAFLERK